MLSSQEKIYLIEEQLKVVDDPFDLMYYIAYNRLIKFSSVYVAVAQFTANNTLNLFNKLKKLR